MAIEYFETRVDTFLATTVIKSRDHVPYRQTEEEMEQRCKELIEVADKSERLTI